MKGVSGARSTGDAGGGAGSDWDTSAVLWCLYPPGECSLWEAEAAVSWLSWKEKAQGIFTHVRHVYNPLSLNIRLLTVEN